MAKKNEILLSIALEGDQDVKAKLKAVGEEGKKSLADIERNLGKAGQNFGRTAGSAAERAIGAATRPLGKVSEALAPFLEGAGLGRLGASLSGLGSGTAGGLLGRLFGGAGTAAGLAALSGAALHLARVREETEKTDARLKGLGGGRDAIDKLNASSKKLGVDPKSIEGDLADFLSTRRRSLAEQSGGVIHPPGFVPPENQTLPKVFQGGRLISGPVATEDQFLAAREALTAGARLDKKSSSEAQDPISQLLKGVNISGLTGDLVRQFGTALPNDANLLSRVFGPVVGRGFGNSDQFASFLDKNGPIGADKFFDQLAKEEPKISKETADQRGLSDSLDGLTASVKRTDTAFGNLLGGPLGKTLAGGVDKAAEVIGKGADKIPELDRQVRAAEFAPGGSQFIGPVRPEDVATAPKSIGEVFSSDKGDLLGRIVGFIRSGDSGQNNGFGGANPFGAISDFLSKAFVNPAALQEKVRPAEGPSALEPESRLRQEPPQQNSAAQNLLDGVSAAINSLNRQNLKIDDPASSLGIRGEAAPDVAKNVAGLDSAASQATVSLGQFASGLELIISQLQGIGGSGAPLKVQTAAGGGMIRQLDGGGHISGPGTSTSDSIPAMLSDGEYVIKESSARRIGRRALDWLNAGGRFARGGAADYSKWRRFAEGGNARYGRKSHKRDGMIADNGDNAVFKTGDGYVREFYDSEGNKISEETLNYNPLTGISAAKEAQADAIQKFNEDAQKAAYNQADREADAEERKKKAKRHKSDFVGPFGGHVFGDSGSYAKGGPVIDLPGFAEGGLVGDIGMGSAPVLDDAGAPAAVLGHYKVDLSTNHGDFQMMADEEVARKLSNAARDKAIMQTGPSPTWVGGS